jgi:hypothetical protein
MKRRTTVVISVKMELPTGANGKDALEFVRDALTDHKKWITAPLDKETPSTHPMAMITLDSITVSLLSKLTEYK